MLEELKKSVYESNMLLSRYNLVIFTWGNVSAIDRNTGLVVIKPSGIEYENLSPDMMVVVDLDGNIKEGTLNPSSDTPTHLELYKTFPEMGGIVHTHSEYATAFAQALRPISAYGTTHADYFYGSIPCTRILTREEVENGYEVNTGKVIAETLKGKDVSAVPGVLVANHGVFTWGKDAFSAVYHAAVAEKVAKMAALTEMLNSETKPVNQYIMDKHYNRKHGKNAYYGQNKQA